MTFLKITDNIEEEDHILILNLLNTIFEAIANHPIAFMLKNIPDWLEKQTQ